MKSPPESLVGKTLAGCCVERELGAGAQGQVVLARRLVDGKRFVVKVLAAEMSENPEHRQRFQREGLALLGLPPHPNVVSIESLHVDEERPCLVMELVEGDSLRTRLKERRGQPLPPREALRVCREVARGMHCVHAHGLFHRDLKPANVMVGRRGAIKIVDFGVVKDINQTTLTVEGQLIGTAPFLPPECWRNEPLRAPGEIFALGVMLYELLTGVRPFQGETLQEMALAITRGTYESAGSRVPGLPAAVDVLLALMLATEERYRYADMSDVAVDIGSVLAGGGCHVPCLVERDGGRRHSLLAGNRFLLGRDSSCELNLNHPSVSERHAQLRRADTGFELRGMRGNSGTFAEGEALRGPLILEHGNRLRLGELELVFEEWTRRPRTHVLNSDVVRTPWPEPVLRALAALRDPRAIVGLLEQLSPDPLGQLRAEQALALVTGPDAARAAAPRAGEEAERERRWAVKRLQQIAPVGTPPTRWLSWWMWARTEHVRQVVMGPREESRLVLEVVEGLSDSPVFSLASEGMVSIGRAETCGVRLNHRTVSREHATLLRLDRRWVVRDRGKPAGTQLNGAQVEAALLATGDVLQLGDVKLAVRPSPVGAPPVDGGVHAVDPSWFVALADGGHPSTVCGLARCLEPDTGWVSKSRAALFPSDALDGDRFQKLIEQTRRERRDWARQCLARLLGRDLGEHPAPWRQAVEARRAELLAQVGPCGWWA